MADQKFHKKTSNFTLGELANLCECKVVNDEDKSIKIEDVSPIDSAKKGEITFLQNKKYRKYLESTNASACIISESEAENAPKEIALLISEDPYYSYALLTQAMYKRTDSSFEVSEKADVDFSASIGNNTRIMSGVHIGAECIIGQNCVIHPNVTITNTIIGDNVIIHPGCSIGQDGFGYAFNNGKHHKVMQLGRVIIENDVEIGANSTIDRGAGPDTLIGEGSKIDNLVQIGHNVEIGKHCIIVSQVGISGSTKIGDYSVIGGQVGIAGHLEIGSGVQIAAQSGVMKNIGPKEVIGGSPAVPIKEFHRQTIAVKKLTSK